ncbi:hypothetical protein MBLNU230_g5889t1 [Neophaeotheca triangularis]
MEEIGKQEGHKRKRPTKSDRRRARKANIAASEENDTTPAASLHPSTDVQPTLDATYDSFDVRQGANEPLDEEATHGAGRRQLQENNDLLKQNCAKLEADSYRLKHAPGKRNEENAKLRDTNAVLEGRIYALEKDLAAPEATEGNVSTLDELTTVRMELSSVKAELTGVRNRLVSAASTKMGQDCGMYDLGSEIDKLLNANRLLSEKVAVKTKAKENIAALKEDVAVLKDANTAWREEKYHELDILKAEKSVVEYEAKENIAALKEANTTLEEETEKLQEDIAEMEREAKTKLAAIQDESEEKIAALEEANRTLERKNKKLQEEIVEVETDAKTKLAAIEGKTKAELKGSREKEKMLRGKMVSGLMDRLDDQKADFTVQLADAVADAARLREQVLQYEGGAGY